jgi:hypothetical protein
LAVRLPPAFAALAASRFAFEPVVAISQKMMLSSAMTTTRPIKKMIPTTLPKNLSMARLRVDVRS